jgi:hypothetical protein
MPAFTGACVLNLRVAIDCVHCEYLYVCLEAAVRLDCVLCYDKSHVNMCVTIMNALLLLTKVHRCVHCILYHSVMFACIHCCV